MRKNTLGAHSKGKRFLCVLMVFYLLFTASIPSITAHAQIEDPIIVQAPDTSNFPTITVPFKLPTSQKALNSEIQLSQLDIIENGENVQPEALREEHAGVNFTLAINPNRQLDLRDADGISPYDKIRDALIEWIETRSSLVGDRYSFVSDIGVELNNSNDRKNWVDALSAYQPNFRAKEPQLDSLESAINLVSERVVAFGVDKSLLYITPALLPEQLDPFNQLAAQAISAEIQVNIWYVGDPYFLTNNQGGLLMNLADETGGNFLYYSGTEDIPNPESYLENLGKYFELTYQSKIREIGSFPLRIELTTSDVTLNGESPPFYLEVQPPNPILISPPGTITRTQAEDESADLTPSSQSIEIMVEFPDSHPRAILSSQLFVDGDLVDERDSPPYDVLIWDLKSYSESGQHHIQVEVTDSLGLSSKTILTPVQIEIAQTTTEEQPEGSQSTLIYLGIVLGIAAVGFVVWLINRFWQSGRFETILPRQFGESKPSARLASKPFIKKDQEHALLLPLDAQSNLDQDSYNLTQYRVKIGSDPVQSSLILENPSVEGLHALLIQYEGEFWLNDMGSREGTWINYARIGKQPVRIHPGDVLHFGQCGFRFTMPEHLQTSHVNVSKYEPIL